MKYRILYIKHGDLNPHFEVQYRKWFRWHTVTDWHDHLPFKVPLQWQEQTDAEKYIERQSKTQIVVYEQDVYSYSTGYFGEIKYTKLPKLPKRPKYEWSCKEKKTTSNTKEE